MQIDAHKSVIGGKFSGLSGKDVALGLVDTIFSREVFTHVSWTGATRSAAGIKKECFSKLERTIAFFHKLVASFDSTYQLHMAEAFFMDCTKNSKRRWIAYLNSSAKRASRSKAAPPHGYSRRSQNFNDDGHGMSSASTSAQNADDVNPLYEKETIHTDHSYDADTKSPTPSEIVQLEMKDESGSKASDKESDKESDREADKESDLNGNADDGNILTVMNEDLKESNQSRKKTKLRRRKKKSVQNPLESL